MQFCSPRTVEEAVSELATPGATALGGGTSIGLLLGQRMIEPSKLVWTERVEGLAAIRQRDDGCLELGSALTLLSLHQSSTVREVAPALAEAAGKVGNLRVRAVATLGGALAHGDPRQDLPPVLVALGAAVHLRGPAGEREVPLGQFFTGFLETALGDSELITRVSVPSVPRRRAVYARFTPGSESDYPTVGVAASVVVCPDGVVTDAVVALAGVGPTVLAVPEVAAALVGSRGDRRAVDQAAQAAESAACPSDDQRGSARYKRAMTAVWVRRALGRAVAESAATR